MTSADDRALIFTPAARIIVAFVVVGVLFGAAVLAFEHGAEAQMRRTARQEARREVRRALIREYDRIDALCRATPAANCTVTTKLSLPPDRGDDDDDGG